MSSFSLPYDFSPVRIFTRCARTPRAWSEPSPPTACIEWSLSGEIILAVSCGGPLQNRQHTSLSRTPSPPLSRETFTPKVSRTAPRTVHSDIRSARNAHTPLRATTYGYHPRRIHSLHSEQELEHLKVKAWTGLSVRRWRCLRFRCSGIL